MLPSALRTTPLVRGGLLIQTGSATTSNTADIPDQSNSSFDLARAPPFGTASVTSRTASTDQASHTRASTVHLAALAQSLGLAQTQLCACTGIVLGFTASAFGTRRVKLPCL